MHSRCSAHLLSMTYIFICYTVASLKGSTLPVLDQYYWCVQWVLCARAQHARHLAAFNFSAVLASVSLVQTWFNWLPALSLSTSTGGGLLALQALPRTVELRWLVSHP